MEAKIQMLYRTGAFNQSPAENAAEDVDMDADDYLDEEHVEKSLVGHVHSSLLLAGT
jgi:hypothetical protein